MGKIREILEKLVNKANKASWIAETNSIAGDKVVEKALDTAEAEIKESIDWSTVTKIIEDAYNPEKGGVMLPSALAATHYIKQWWDNQ